MLMMNQIFGQWYLGNVETLGISAEAWYWNSGYFGAEPLGGGPGTSNRNEPALYQKLYPAFPATFWAYQLFLGAAQGAVAFRMEPAEYQNPVEVYSGDFWDKNLEPTPLLKGSILPAMQFLSTQALIPTRSQVNRAVRAIAVDDNSYPYDSNNPLGPLRDILSVAPGYHYTYQMVPNTGRYFFIPAFFGNTVNKADFILKDSNIQILDAKDAVDQSKLRERLDALYPETSTGDASVLRVGDSIFVFNSWENEDKQQSYRIPFSGIGGISMLSGQVGPQNLIVGVEAPTGLSLQINNRSERTSVLEFHAASKPAISADPQTSLIASEWNQEASILSVKLSHTNGAVNLTLGSPKKEDKEIEAKVQPPLSLRSFRAQPIAATKDQMILSIVNAPAKLAVRVGDSNAMVDDFFSPELKVLSEENRAIRLAGKPKGDDVLSVESADPAETVKLRMGDFPSYSEVDWLDQIGAVSTNYGPVSGTMKKEQWKGKEILAISADFKGNKPGGYACLSAPAESDKFGPARSIGFWMQGDNSGSAFAIVLLDEKGETFVYFLPGGVNWSGWRFVTVPLENHPKHPSRSYGYEGPEAGEIHWPVKAKSIEFGYMHGLSAAVKILPGLFVEENQ
jgi:hypothetical protein